MRYDQVTLPPRTWIELDEDDLAIAVRQYAESNGIVVPPGEFRLLQRNHRSLCGVTMGVSREPQLRLVR